MESAENRTRFSDSDLPALFRPAGRAASATQTKYFMLVRAQLSMLLIGSLADLAVQITEVSSFAYIGVAAYIVLVVPRLNTMVNEPGRCATRTDLSLNR